MKNNYLVHINKIIKLALMRLLSEKLIKLYNRIQIKYSNNTKNINYGSIKIIKKDNKLTIIYKLYDISYINNENIKFRDNNNSSILYNLKDNEDDKIEEYGNDINNKYIAESIKEIDNLLNSNNI